MLFAAAFALTLAPQILVPTTNALRSPHSRGAVSLRAEPSSEELRKYGLTMDDIRQYGNRTPAEVANMKKWGRILSQKDTFDGDYLKKTDATVPPSESRSNAGSLILVAASTAVLAGLAANLNAQ